MTTTLLRKTILSALTVAAFVIGGLATQTAPASAQANFVNQGVRTSGIQMVFFSQGSFRYLGNRTWLLSVPQGDRHFTENGRGDTTIHLYDRNSNSGIQLSIATNEILMSQGNGGWRTVDRITGVRGR